MCGINIWNKNLFLLDSRFKIVLIEVVSSLKNKKNISEAHSIKKITFKFKTTEILRFWYVYPSVYISSK